MNSLKDAYEFQRAKDTCLRFPFGPLMALVSASQNQRKSTYACCFL